MTSVTGGPLVQRTHPATGMPSIPSHPLSCNPYGLAGLQTYSALLDYPDTMAMGAFDPQATSSVVRYSGSVLPYASGSAPPYFSDLVPSYTSDVVPAFTSDLVQAFTDTVPQLCPRIRGS